MADDIYVTNLRRAAQFEGSTQALASRLRVPESTLLRWMAGRAMMPMQAFTRMLDSISAQEVLAPAARAGSESNMSFYAEDLMGRCRKCGGTAFAADAPVRLADALACLACGELIVHRDLLLELAERLASRRRARAAERKRTAVRSGALAGVRQ